MIARGRVLSVHPGAVRIRIPAVAIGDCIQVASEAGAVPGTVCAIEDDCAIVAVHGSLHGVTSGSSAFSEVAGHRLPLGMCALGRAFGANGELLDGGPPLRGPLSGTTHGAPPPDERCDIDEPLWTGIKAIDAMLTVGRGARVGIFGAPGLGKSTLLESIVQGVAADAVVVALIGERGREAQRWIAACNARTSIICATSDRAAQERVRAADVAIAHAQRLSRSGLHVLVIFDSLARYATALREVGLAAGESVGRGGYPASVFAALARLLERCGATMRGTVSLLATVLNDGSERDPVSDAARSLLDGHIELSAQRAAAGRFPAIDVLRSTSRTMPQVISKQHDCDARRLRAAMSRLESTADARALGLAVSTMLVPDIMAEPAIERLLQQDAEPVPPGRSLRMLAEIADTLGEAHGYPD